MLFHNLPYFDCYLFYENGHEVLCYIKYLCPVSLHKTIFTCISKPIFRVIINDLEQLAPQFSTSNLLGSLTPNLSHLHGASSLQQTIKDPSPQPGLFQEVGILTGRQAGLLSASPGTSQQQQLALSAATSLRQKNMLHNRVTKRKKLKFLEKVWHYMQSYEMLI